MIIPLAWKSGRTARAYERIEKEVKCSNEHGESQDITIVTIRDGSGMTLLDSTSEIHRALWCL